MGQRVLDKGLLVGYTVDVYVCRVIIHDLAANVKPLATPGASAFYDLCLYHSIALFNSFIAASEPPASGCRSLASVL